MLRELKENQGCKHGRISITFLKVVWIFFFCFFLKKKVGTEMSVRRPDLATEYVAPPYVAPDELPPDFMALLSLLCGLVGICIKVCVSTCVLAYSACMQQLRVSLSRGALLNCCVCISIFAVEDGFVVGPLHMHVLGGECEKIPG